MCLSPSRCPKGLSPYKAFWASLSSTDYCLPPLYFIFCTRHSWELPFTPQWEECCKCLVCADMKYPSRTVTGTKYKIQGWEAVVSAWQRRPKSFIRRKPLRASWRTQAHLQGRNQFLDDGSRIKKKQANRGKSVLRLWPFLWLIWLVRPNSTPLPSVSQPKWKYPNMFHLNIWCSRFFRKLFRSHNNDIWAPKQNILFFEEKKMCLTYS